MVKKGECHGDCGFHHGVKKNPSENKEKQVCYWEFEAAGKCNRGDACKFSHEISDSERQNTDLRNKIEMEKKTKKDVCINEFNKIGSCWKKERCSFRHDISSQERGSKKMKEAVQKKYEQMKKKTGKESYLGSQKVEENLVSCLKDLLSRFCP